MELPKKYDPSVEEPEMQDLWKTNQVFKFNRFPDKEIYSIDTPPPYVSADHLHVGHAMHYSQFEFVARYKRMRGFNVFFPMGFDDNGLPTERYVEKKHNINKSKTTREEFVKLCLEETKKGGQVYRDLWTSLGISVDWDLLYSTIDPRSQAVSQKSFIDLYKKGRLEYIDQPTVWCTRCQTTIAQADFDNVDMSSHFNDIVFKVGGKDLVIATTRPELLPACVAVFAHPTDVRYKDLFGKFAKVPLFDYEVPILPDEKADPEKGTGIVMCCTFGDKTDIEWWYKHKLPLKIAITEDGKMNDAAQKYAGMPIKEARKAIIDDLKEAELLIAQKQITHPVNVHERCATEIEFLKKKQWAIKVLDKKQELIDLADKMNWYPEFMKVRYTHWVQNLQWNWAISRQRFYGVPFPVWYSKKTGEIILPDEGDLPVDPRESMPKTLPDGHTAEDIAPEMDVMDTWMTSSVSPQVNQHWGMESERKDFMPMTMRPQAHDIIRTWAFYTITKSLFHNNDIPWKDIMISGHGQDPKGRKMSKSLGNVVFPKDMIAKYSADALRFWSASVKLGSDLPFKEEEVANGQKIITKLWNSFRFAMMHLEDYKPSDVKLELMDKWVLSKMQALIKDATDHFDKYEYSKTKVETENFFWRMVCDNYLEICKDRLYNPDKRGEEARNAAQYTLYQLMLTTIKLFAPIMPHITEKIYQAYYKQFENDESIHIAAWPSSDTKLVDAESEKIGDLFIDILNAVRKAKADSQVSVGKPVQKVIIKGVDEKTLAPVLDDLKSVTRAETIEFSDGDEMSVEVEL